MSKIPDGIISEQIKKSNKKLIKFLLFLMALYSHNFFEKKQMKYE